MQFPHLLIFTHSFSRVFTRAARNIKGRHAVHTCSTGAGWGVGWWWDSDSEHHTVHGRPRVGLGHCKCFAIAPAGWCAYVRVQAEMDDLRVRRGARAKRVRVKGAEVEVWRCARVKGARVRCTKAAHARGRCTKAARARGRCTKAARATAKRARRRATVVVELSVYFTQRNQRELACLRPLCARVRARCSSVSPKQCLTAVHYLLLPPPIASGLLRTMTRAKHPSSTSLNSGGVTSSMSRRLPQHSNMYEKTTYQCRARPPHCSLHPTVLYSPKHALSHSFFSVLSFRHSFRTPHPAPRPARTSPPSRPSRHVASRRFVPAPVSSSLTLLTHL